MATNPSSAIAYWQAMKDKAAENLSAMTDKPVPGSESEAKCIMAHAMRHGTYAEAAGAIGEYAEWIIAHMMLTMHEANATA